MLQVTRKIGLIVLVMGSLVKVQLCAAAAPGNPPGWAWLIEPKPTTTSVWSERGVLGLTALSSDGGLDIVIALKPSAGSTYRVVAFDSDGKRHELHGMGSGNGEFSLNRYMSSVDSLPFSKATSFGVEVLSPDGWETASAAAAIEASAAGLQPLPLPVVGQPYEFDLLGVDGQRIESQSVLGKVVLIDCWATWCTPCMKKMPALKLMYERWHEAGLDIVGVNFDQDAGKAQEVVADLKLPWPQVRVPSDVDSRRLWWEVSSISTLPRLLVVDRRGILAADCSNPDELAAVLEDLVGGDRQ